MENSKMRLIVSVFVPFSELLALLQWQLFMLRLL